MQVVRLKAGARWTVYALCDPDGDCPLLHFITELENRRLAGKILADLQDLAANYSPQQWHAMEFSKDLGNDVYEFRWPQKRGGTPRVFWFYQPGRIIVCTHGINKKGKLSQKEIDSAAEIKALYEAAAKAKSLVIVDVDDYDVD
jgi:phage-related protein